MTDASSYQLAAIVPTAANPNGQTNGLAVIAVTRETPPKAGGGSVASLATVVVMNETPPQAGGAQIAAASIVMVQIEYKQPLRSLQLPLITAPNAFPLFIAKV